MWVGSQEAWLWGYVHAAIDSTHSSDHFQLKTLDKWLYMRCPDFCDQNYNMVNGKYLYSSLKAQSFSNYIQTGLRNAKFNPFQWNVLTNVCFMLSAKLLHSQVIWQVSPTV